MSFVLTYFLLFEGVCNALSARNPRFFHAGRVRNASTSIVRRLRFEGINVSGATSAYSCGVVGIPEGIIYGVPVTTENGEYKRIEGLEIDAFSRERLDFTLKELLEERDGVKDLLK